MGTPAYSVNPPAPYYFHVARQILDQFGMPFEGVHYVEEGFSPNPPNGNCTSYSVETPPSFSNEAGVFDDNFYLPGNAPNPCTSTSTQGFYIDQYPIQTTYSVTWQYSGVSVQGP